MEKKEKAGLFFTELCVGLVLLGLFAYDQAFFFNEVSDSHFEVVEATVRGLYFDSGGSGRNYQSQSGYWVSISAMNEEGNQLCFSDANISKSDYKSMQRGDLLDALLMGDRCFLEEDVRWRSSFRTRLWWYLLGGGALLLHVLFMICRYVKKI